MFTSLLDMHRLLGFSCPLFYDVVQMDGFSYSLNFIDSIIFVLSVRICRSVFCFLHDFCIVPLV